MLHWQQKRSICIWLKLQIKQWSRKLIEFYISSDWDSIYLFIMTRKHNPHFNGSDLSDPASLQGGHSKAISGCEDQAGVEEGPLVDDQYVVLDLVAQLGLEVTQLLLQDSQRWHDNGLWPQGAAWLHVVIEPVQGEMWAELRAKFPYKSQSHSTSEFSLKLPGLHSEPKTHARYWTC